MLVADASLVVAALLNRGSVGDWARELLASERLIAPHLMPAEVASTMRRAEHAGMASPDAVTLAYADLFDLRIELFAFRPFASRVRELGGAVTSYDAWYVALAESFGVDVGTLDLRLARAPGPRCRFITPPPSLLGS